MDDRAIASRVEATLSGRPHGICPHCGAAVFDNADEQHVVIEISQKDRNGPRRVSGYYISWCVTSQRRVNGDGAALHRDITLTPGQFIGIRFEDKTYWHIAPRSKHSLLRKPIRVK